MGFLGLSEIMVILLITLIVVGPEKLPELAQKLGRLVWQLKHSAEELRKELSLPSKDEIRTIEQEILEIKNSTNLITNPAKSLLDQSELTPNLNEQNFKTCEELSEETNVSKENPRDSEKK
ncbi:MAG TPA: twin-arginine translocase TatA/TatE family subunit [Oligoflexia bacterium]|nr:twin-arginine translocase TatA/TatE family subunit [Oligoflexia bacterium]HMP47279.1 twin-arginine translocase TatA/TatE family subunit [Oligoflexia bacterium]